MVPHYVLRTEYNIRRFVAYSTAQLSSVEFCGSKCQPTLAWAAVADTVHASVSVPLANDVSSPISFPCAGLNLFTQGATNLLGSATGGHADTVAMGSMVRPTHPSFTVGWALQVFSGVAVCTVNRKRNSHSTTCKTCSFLSLLRPSSRVPCVHVFVAGDEIIVHACRFCVARLQSPFTGFAITVGGEQNTVVRCDVAGKP